MDLTGIHRLYKPIRVSQFLGMVESSLQPQETQRSKRPVTADAPRQYDLNNCTILLADDNRTNRLIAEKMLRNCEVELHFAKNGAEAVDLFRDQFPNIVFMDLSMPAMDGFEATAAIRALEDASGVSDRKVPIVALTANASEGLRDRCLASGMSDFLTKPIVKDALLQMISKYTQAGSGDPGAQRRPDVGVIADLSSGSSRS